MGFLNIHKKSGDNVLNLITKTLSKQKRVHNKEAKKQMALNYCQLKIYGAKYNLERNYWERVEQYIKLK